MRVCSCHCACVCVLLKVAVAKERGHSHQSQWRAHIQAPRRNCPVWAHSFEVVCQSLSSSLELNSLCPSFTCYNDYLHALRLIFHGLEASITAVQPHGSCADTHTSCLPGTPPPWHHQTACMKTYCTFPLYQLVGDLVRFASVRLCVAGAGDCDASQGGPPAGDCDPHPQLKDG